MSFARSLPPLMTADQFIAWPGDGVNRLHQLVDGEAVAMSPPSWRHGAISGELCALLRNHLRAIGSPCRAVIEPGVQPQTGAAQNVRVPDLGVSRSPIDTHYMRDPVVLVEILSPSNVLETREAVRIYLSIPSVQEVLVIDSRTIRAEMLRRQADGSWPAEPVVCAGEGRVEIATFGFNCPLAALYPE